jgi:hypothetical protein
MARAVAEGYLEVRDLDRTFEWCARIGSDIDRSRCELMAAWHHLRGQRDPAPENDLRYLALKKLMAKDSADIDSRLELAEILLAEAAMERERSRSRGETTLAEEIAVLGDERMLKPNDPRPLCECLARNKAQAAVPPASPRDR